MEKKTGTKIKKVDKYVAIDRKPNVVSPLFYFVAADVLRGRDSSVGIVTCYSWAVREWNPNKISQFQSKTPFVFISLL